MAPYPLVLLGHGTRDTQGRQAFLEFAEQFQIYAPSRPVVPCFLELTDPLLPVGIKRCLDMGYTEITVLPVLLFAARHSKFDITNALDQARSQHPNLTIHYGRHLGVALPWIDLWRQRLEQADQASSIPPEDTVLLYVGRGASDPDANGDVCKLARLLWEGSAYKGIEVCFTGITHPRMEGGFARAWTWQPKRIVVIPHLLFTGVLVKRIQTIAATTQAEHPDVDIQVLPHIGTDPILFQLMREREQEAQLGQVAMNCDLCKFRRAVSQQVGADHHHHHHHDHNDHHQDPAHAHEHTHRLGSEPVMYHGTVDLYPDPKTYQQRAWQVP